jgi:hypothetical protein
MLKGRKNKVGGRREGKPEKKPAQSAASNARHVAGKGYDQQRAAVSPGAQIKPSAPMAAATPQSYVVRGQWDSFYEWHLLFEGDELLDSHTDDLPSSEWPTEVHKSGDMLTLVQETEASDARITEEMVIKFVAKPDGSRAIEVISAKTTYLDYTADGEISTTIVTGLSAE